MKAELVAEQTVALPAGLVRLTLARHDDGHYSGVATLVQTGQRIGLLESESPLAGQPSVSDTRVDAALAGPEVGTCPVQKPRPEPSSTTLLRRGPPCTVMTSTPFA